MEEENNLKNKKKKRIFYIIVIILLILLLVIFIMQLIDKNMKKKYIFNQVGVDVSNAKLIYKYNNYSGFSGDVISCYIYEYSKNNSIENDIKKIDTWKELPLSENCEKLVYGSKYIKPHISNQNQESFLEKVENGYYCFIDRHIDSKNKLDDTQIFERDSLNLTIAIYDIDTNKFYFLEMNT